MLVTIYQRTIADRIIATRSASCLVAPAFSPSALAQMRQNFLNYCSKRLIKSFGASQSQRGLVGNTPPLAMFLR